MKLNTVLIIMAMLLFVESSAFAQQKKEEKQTCVTSKCHATMGKEKFVHGPVAVGDCSACHKLLSKEEHKFQKITSSVALCSKCHEPLDLKKNVHAPVMKGNCTGCHSPHQSNQ
ncbi:MAG: cytochrome c3 family protein, partial [Pseudomonadota bacterium]